MSMTGWLISVAVAMSLLITHFVVCSVPARANNAHVLPFKLSSSG